MVNFEDFLECKQILKKAIYSKCQLKNEDEFNNLINTYCQNKDKSLDENIGAIKYAEYSYKSFMESLKNVDDVDFDKEVKLLAKALEKSCPGRQ
ncbi:hypothetical protein EHP00_1560 [Ecytonucleospora hepatopenaei]|uniref:Uncharacterized protein n=1 Tax=Ecytonucleospora hepatopenaei TaxID=646526 RepID=A0A1W0E2P0_9MICR|nr:hypothetical protein EHP00_2658 [Ecytonucleospora hepatopenaei]OQS53496.1 hypothetical protein EHP00_2661 [Ecytonucleospora hepatopenaei]OQS55157.1 hypothetical protein EHP00_1560 [Ecytonucleospora hepatopenaei]